MRHGKVETRTAPTTPDASSLQSSGYTIKSDPSFILTASSISEAETSSGTQGRPPCVFPSAMPIPIEIPCVIEVAEIVFFRSILGTQLIEIIIRHQFAIGSLP